MNIFFSSSGLNELTRFGSEKFQTLNAGKTVITSGLSFILSVIIFILCGASPLQAAEAWPSSGQWVKLYNANWNVMTDPSGDFSQGSIDFANDVNGTAAYYYASTTSIYFRFSLRDTPKRTSVNELVQFAWYVAFDVNDDTYPDWAIMVGGITETLRTFYNPGIDNDPEVMYTNIANPLTTGDVRVVAGGYTTFPDLTYLDVQVPFTALQAAGYNRNITRYTPLRMFYSTSTSEAVVIKDALGPSTTVQAAFADALTLILSGTGAYGYIYDSRDPTPYSASGTWLRNETVTLTGRGWPPSTSTYYNGGARNIRILNSGQTVVWSGSVTTNSNGNLTAAPSWPVATSIPPGVYTIAVQDPTNPALWLTYDTFTVAAPTLTITKTVTPSTVSSGSPVTYTITIPNSGTTAGQLVTVTETLPFGFTYNSGSTSGLTTANPGISGQQLIWNGSWSVPVAGQVTLTFQALTGLTRGTYQNVASASGGNFAAITSGNTAPVTVQSPQLILSKTTSRSTGTPGDIITYTVTYTNTGNATAQNIFILENVPNHTTYVHDSAIGTGMTILYSHDYGLSYNTSQTAPVTNLSFQRATGLSAAGSGSLSFQVRIK